MEDSENHFSPYITFEDKFNASSNNLNKMVIGESGVQVSEVKCRNMFCFTSVIDLFQIFNKRKGVLYNQKLFVN